MGLRFRQMWGICRLAYVVTAILAFIGTGCGSDSDGNDLTVEDARRLVALHAEADPVNGGRIVDSEGRQVLLRGANVNALAEYWQATDFPTTFALNEADADLMAEIGWNAVRLLLSWSRVEPEPGVYDNAYLAQVRAAVDMLAQRGIYSIIDLHQDAWGATLAARPGEVCPEGSEPAFGWDGGPGWATIDLDRARCVQNGVREFSPAVVGAFRSFWNDVEGPGGIGIRTRYARMLGHVAGLFARHEAVAGYDVMNEPNAFRPQDQMALADLHSAALREIRAAEEAAGGFPHLLLFEPSALWSTFGMGPPPDFERDDNVVYAPHIYTGGFDGGPITEGAFEIALEEARLFGGAPVLSGEWGADPRRASDPNDPYFVAHQNLQDRFLFSATLWTWRESCGDPHKAADYRAGRQPYVWGEFDVDCDTNQVQGQRLDLIEELTRAQVRAAPGRLVEVIYQHDGGLFRVRGEAAKAGASLAVFYPSSKHGEAGTGSTGLRNVEIIPAAGGNIYVVGEAIGGDWTLDVDEVG